MNITEHRLNETTEKIIGCAFRVSDIGGSGFLEKVYENALALEVRKARLEVVQQAEAEVIYDGIVVGEYRVDLLVKGSVIVELKATAKLTNVDMAQCLNYLKASKLRICLLLNFGKPKLEIRRVGSSGSFVCDGCGAWMSFGDSERADRARFRDRLPRSLRGVAGWFAAAPWRGDDIMAAKRVGSYGAYPPLKAAVGANPNRRGKL